MFPKIQAERCFEEGFLHDLRLLLRGVRLIYDQKFLDAEYWAALLQIYQYVF